MKNRITDTKATGTPKPNAMISALVGVRSLRMLLISDSAGNASLRPPIIPENVIHIASKNIFNNSITHISPSFLYRFFKIFSSISKSAGQDASFGISLGILWKITLSALKRFALYLLASNLILTVFGQASDRIPTSEYIISYFCLFFNSF